MAYRNLKVLSVPKRLAIILEGNDNSSRSCFLKKKKSHDMAKVPPINILITLSILRGQFRPEMVSVGQQVH